MRVEVEHDGGRWFSLSWSAMLYADDSNRMWVGYGIGFTRNGAIRQAFRDAGEKFINPPKKTAPPVHQETLRL